VTDDQQGRQAHDAPQGGGRWDPLPQGDYDDGATAFVNLPEGGIDALLAGDSPLAAPGHGYVPPQITVTPATTAGTDPAAPGTWSMPGPPADGAQWADPQEPARQQGTQHPGAQHPGIQQPGGDDRFTYHPGATGQWVFEEPAAAPEPAPAPGHDVTGQWSIPVAGGDLPDESGEFTTSALVEQWGGTPPATLPGGAAAPWATGAPGQPWGPPEAAPDHTEQPADGTHGAGRHAVGGAAVHPADPSVEAGHAAPHGPAGDHAHAPHPAAAAEQPYGTGAEHAGHTGHAGPGGGLGTEPAPEQAAQAPDAAQAAQDPADGPEEPAGPPAAADGGTDAADAADPAQVPDDATAAPEPDAAEPEVPDAPDEAEAAVSDAAAPDAAEPAAAESAAPEAAAESAAPGETPPHDGVATAAPAHDEHPLVSYVLRVNGTERPVSDAWIGESLLYVLRERLGLAGAKDGCSQGECGACNVQVDGRLVASCLVPAATAAGSEVRTVEGLAVDGQPSDVQRALARCGAVQCGFCVPGMAMTVHDLLEGNPAPTELEARQALCGNLCRCSGYRGVLEAVREVVAEREAHTEAHTGADAETDAGEARIPHQAGPGAGGVHPSAFETAPGDGAPHGQAYGPDQGHAHGPDQGYAHGPEHPPGPGPDHSPGPEPDHEPGPGPAYGHGQGQDGGQA
jgi:aerobic-type carbon monoxide dehydrogenase small subunit (CoxS/CutS family)